MTQIEQIRNTQNLKISVQPSEINNLSVIDEGDPYNNAGLTDGEKEIYVKNLSNPVRISAATISGDKKQKFDNIKN